MREQPGQSRCTRKDGGWLGAVTALSLCWIESSCGKRGGQDTPLGVIDLESVESGNQNIQRTGGVVEKTGSRELQHLATDWNNRQG